MYILPHINRSLWGKSVGTDSVTIARSHIRDGYDVKTEVLKPDAF